MNKLAMDGRISHEELRQWEMDNARSAITAASMSFGGVGAIRAGPLAFRYLFGKGALLNSGRHLRIGIGREQGQSVFRAAGDALGKVPKPMRDALGIKEIKPGVFKWDLWRRGGL